MTGADVRGGMSDLYEVLGVDRAATADAIKKAYHAKLLEHHPDKNKDADGEDFAKIHEAWKVLSTESSRRQYDALLHQSASAVDTANKTVFLNELLPVSDGDGDLVYTACRCGDEVVVSRSLCLDEKEVLVECDTCSLVVRVLGGQEEPGVEQQTSSVSSA